MYKIHTRNFHLQNSSRSIYYTITLWFPCLDGLIQTRGNVARVKKSERTRAEGKWFCPLFLTRATFPSAFEYCFPNIPNIPKCSRILFSSVISQRWPFAARYFEPWLWCSVGTFHTHKTSFNFTYFTAIIQCMASTSRLYNETVTHC
jgi:hypothetical protein